MITHLVRFFLDVSWIVRSFQSSMRLRQFSLAAATEGVRFDNVGSVDTRRFNGGIPGIAYVVVVVWKSWDWERPLGGTRWYHVRRSVGMGNGSTVPVSGVLGLGLESAARRLGDEKENG